MDNLQRVNLTKSFNKLCSSVIKYRVVDNRVLNYKGFNGVCIGAFKRIQEGLHHRIIISSLSTDSNFNYSSKDISTVIYRLFLICDFEIFSFESMRLLNDIIDNNPCISECNPFSTDQIDQLILIKNKCIENFSSVEEAFTVRDTQELEQTNPVNNSDPVLQNEFNNSDSNLAQNSNIVLDKSFFEESINKLRSEFELKLNQLKIQNSDPDLFLTSERIKEYEFKIKHLFNKKLRFEKNICILNKHLEKGDAPSQLCHFNFPEPFLKHNVKFVSEYNKFICDSQISIMRMSIRHLNDEISILEKDLKFFKRNLNGCVDSVEEFVADIEKSETDFLKNEFLRADNKCETVAVKFFVAEKKDGFSRNFSNNNSSKKKSYNHWQKSRNEKVDDDNMLRNSGANYNKSNRFSNKSHVVGDNMHGKNVNFDSSRSNRHKSRSRNVSTSSRHERETYSRESNKFSNDDNSFKSLDKVENNNKINYKNNNTNMNTRNKQQNFRKVQNLNQKK